MALTNKPTNSTKVIVILGFVVLATALLAPYLGLGERDNFIIYTLTGIQRREVAYIGVALVFVGFFTDFIRTLYHHFVAQLQKRALFALAMRGQQRASLRDYQLSAALPKKRAAMAAPWSVERIRQFSRDQAPLYFTVAALLFFFLAMWMMSGVTSDLTEQWTREIIRQYEWVSSGDQRAAHVLTLAIVAIFAGVCFKLAQLGAIHVWRRPVVSSWGVIQCVTVAILGLIIYCFILSFSFVLQTTVVSVLFLSFVMSAPQIDQRLTRRAMMAIIALYFLALVVPGLIVHPIPLMVDDPVALAQFEMHLDGTTMGSRAIAAGYGFDFLPSGYGYLMPSVMSVIDHLTHDFTIGHQLRFVQYCQLLFCFAAVAAYWCYRPRAYIWHSRRHAPGGALLDHGRARHLAPKSNRSSFTRLAFGNVGDGAGRPNVTPARGLVARCNGSGRTAY